MCFSTHCRHTRGYQLSRSSCRPVPLFVWSRLHSGDSFYNNKKTIRYFPGPFNFTPRYINDVLLLNDSKFCDYVDLSLTLRKRTQQIQLGTLHDFTYTYKLTAKLYDKRDDFNFPIVNVATFQHHQHMAFISMLIRYSRAFGAFQDFFNRWLLLIRKLLNQWFLVSERAIEWVIVV